MNKRWAILRWTCTIALAALVCVSILTIRFACTAVRVGNGPSILLVGGALHVNYCAPTPGGSRVMFGALDGATHVGGAWFLWMGPSDGTWQWTWTWRDSTYGGGTVKERALPLWLPILAFAAASAALWRSHIRARAFGASHCPQCDYSFAGLSPGSPCPECGKRGGGAKP